jgi:predicted RNA-binding protein with EMAP domain
MPTSRFSVFFDPDQPLLMRRWLDSQGVRYTYPGKELLVKVESGEYVTVAAHDVVTHVTGHDWVEVFTEADERAYYAKQARTPPREWALYLRE